MTSNRLYHDTLPDPELSRIIASEQLKQEQYITLIASENYMTPSLLQHYQQCLYFNNEYAEGYPGKRYYGGCEYVDQVENLAIARAKQLFKVGHVNVQPHSGSQANAAVFMSLLSPGDSLLGMKLDHGGHLTHGAKVSFSGHFYHATFYGVDHNGWIDYDQVATLAEQQCPKVIIAGCSAYSRIIDWERFREIADQVGAYLVADIAHIAGLVATDLHPSPVPFADVITTTTHKTLRGPRGGMILVPDAAFAKEKKIDKAVFPGLQGGPLMHVIAAKAAALYEALQPDFKHYQTQLVHNAKAMADTLKERGFPIVSGGTDNHLFLVDLTQHDYSGKVAEAQLEKAHIITNKNMLPYDVRKPSETSGLRLGTPAMTTRGCTEVDAKQIGHWVADVLTRMLDESTISTVKNQVIQRLETLPLYTHSL